MSEVYQLREAIEKMHGGTATLSQTVPVRETFEGRMVWEGVVHVFDLASHRIAARAYAWSSPIEGSTKRRFFAVLHKPPVDSPQAAVRAAIVAEHKQVSRGRERWPTCTCLKKSRIVSVKAAHGPK
jgi:hypothetical protein